MWGRWTGWCSSRGRGQSHTNPKIGIIILAAAILDFCVEYWSTYLKDTFAFLDTITHIIEVVSPKPRSFLINEIKTAAIFDLWGKWTWNYLEKNQEMNLWAQNHLQTNNFTYLGNKKILFFINEKTAAILYWCVNLGQIFKLTPN